MTQLPAALNHAFCTMTLQEPDNAWYMDSGASTHITFNTGNLQSLFYNSTTTHVTIGNRFLVAVLNTGNGIISSPSRSFSLRNVLVSHTIVKNLIFVCKFVTDNFCAVAFDLFGFCIKDLQTRNTLLRCDNVGPLYSVTPSTPSSAHSALSIASLDSSVWHKRFGHPNQSTLSHFYLLFYPAFPKLT